MTDERTTISIQKEIYDEISKRIKNPINGFDSVEDYVDYVLNEILSEEPDDDDEAELSSEEKSKIIKEKFEKLGYM